MVNTEVKFQNINTQFDSVDTEFNEFGTILRNIQASIQALNNQVWQLVRANSERSSGSLPSNTEENSREHLKVKTLRSGKQVETRAKEGPSIKEDRVTV